MPTRLFRNVGFVAIVIVAAIGAMIYCKSIALPLYMDYAKISTILESDYLSVLKTKMQNAD